MDNHPAEKPVNLNDLRVTHSFDATRSLPLEDMSISAGDGFTDIYFTRLEDHLVRLIREADCVVGAVAWLTSARVLTALSQTKGVSIIVQKERYLRSDYTGERSDYYRSLRRAYYALPALPRRVLGGRMTDVRPRDYPTRDAEEKAIRAREIPATLFPIQCLGYDNSFNPRPILHTKFLVFCRQRGPAEQLAPYAVWTGSCNFSRNACSSIENAVVLRDPLLVLSFYQHYLQLAALSEPTEWAHAWPDPTLVADAEKYLEERADEDSRLAEQYGGDVELHSDLSASFPVRSSRRRRNDRTGSWDDWQQDERHWLGD
jgi:hypothetical protein